MSLNVVSAFGSLFNIHLTCMSSGFYVWESPFNCEISDKLKLNSINKDCSRFRTSKICIDAVTYFLALRHALTIFAIKILGVCACLYVYVFFERVPVYIICRVAFYILYNTSVSVFVKMC